MTEISGELSGVSWHTGCKVIAAGPAETGEVFIMLNGSDLAGDTWYIAHEKVKDQILQTALAALTFDRYQHEGKRVDVALSDKAAYSTICRLYITTKDA